MNRFSIDKIRIDKICNRNLKERDFEDYYYEY